MVSKILKLALVAILLVWVSWPIVECFDTWDHEVQTGDDSQYTFIVLSICAGAVYVFSKRKQELYLAAVAQVTRIIKKFLCEYLFVPPFVSFLHWTPDSPSPPAAPFCSVTILRL